MPYYYQDSDNARRNLVTITEDSSMRMNRVLDVSLEDVFIDDEPVTLTEIKDYARIDTDADDGVLEAIIAAARSLCEKWTNISFIQRPAIVSLNNSLGGIYLPYGPVSDITEIVNEDDTAFDTDSYEVRGTKFKQLITPVADYVKITYLAGYETLPEELKTAIKAQAAWMYEHRNEGTEVIAPVAKIYLLPYKRTTV